MSIILPTVKSYDCDRSNVCEKILYFVCGIVSFHLKHKNCYSLSKQGIEL